VVKKNNAKLVGQVIDVLAEGFDEDTITYYGRAYFSAPDIDGKVYFFSGEEVNYGEKLQVKITESKDYDLYGERL
jgi:ribosomal protein S12 methylthiotransferase